MPYLRGKLQFSSSLPLPGRTERCRIFPEKLEIQIFQAKCTKRKENLSGSGIWSTVFDFHEMLF